jgi:TRAP-type uncharacterized transport system fused permease subunit
VEQIKNSTDNVRNQEELIAEFEPEARYRPLTKKAGAVVLVFCLILSLFHIYTAGFGVLQEWKHRAFHLTFVLTLIYLVYNIRKKEMPRRKSLVFSTLYGIISGGLVAIMTAGIFKISLPAALLLFLVVGSAMFYFKERVWLPSHIVPPIDLSISLGGLLFMGYTGSVAIAGYAAVRETSGIPLVIWCASTLGLITLVLLVQALSSLRWLMAGRRTFTVHPLQIPYFDIIFAIIAFALSSYIIVDFDQFLLRAGWANKLDLLLGIFAITLVLEGTRRSIGLPLTIISLIAIIYCYVGPYLVDIPVLSIFAHRGYTVQRIVEHMYTGTEGIYGIPLGVCATYVFHFVLFGLFISHTGLGQLFIDIAMAIAGGSPGGPAKVSVIASGFLGSISGSSIANTVTTGSFTIPLMKRVGYRPEFAGAVEASSSTGGQIMPPIMGAAAFIMAEFLGIPYIKIAFAAVVPAFLHFYAVGVMVHFEALKQGMTGLPREELPRIVPIIKERGIMLLPLLVIVYLLIAGFTPFLAAFWAIIIACSLGQVTHRTLIFFVPVLMSLPSVLLHFSFSQATPGLLVLWFAVMVAGLAWTYRRCSVKDWLLGLIPLVLLVALLAFDMKPFLAALWTNLLVIAIGVFYKDSRMRMPQIINALEMGTRNALAIGAAVASVGLIVGTTMLTGLGLKVGHLTIRMADATAGFVTHADIFHLLPVEGTVLFFILVYAAMACFVLGMGLPTTAQYIIAAIIAAPALLEFGVHPLISHMFVFFYAILADVTPPVALAAYAAAGISGGEPFKIGTTAFSLSSAAYIVPFIFVYSPIILWLPSLLNPQVPFEFLQFSAVFISIFIGVTSLGAGLRGYLVARSTKMEQALCLTAALLFFTRSITTFVIAVLLMTTVYILQKKRKKVYKGAGADSAT